MSEKSELTEEQIEEILDPENLSPLAQRLIEGMKRDGCSPREMAEFLYYEM